MKPFRERLVWSTSSTMLPTTKWSEPRPWSRAASSPLTPLHSDRYQWFSVLYLTDSYSGTKLTTQRPSVARRTRSWPKTKTKRSTERNRPPCKRKSTPGQNTPKYHPLWSNNSVKVDFSLESRPDQDNKAAATDTFLKVKNSTSTSENSRSRNRNKISTFPALNHK